jgi:hypothetical protein
VTPALTTPWVEICAERIAEALVRGDLLGLAAEAWAPNRYIFLFLFLFFIYFCFYSGGLGSQ